MGFYLYQTPLSGPGTGDVVGPGSATDNALVRFDGATGKLLKDSAAILDNSGNLSGLNSISVNTVYALTEITTGDNVITLNDDVVGAPSENAGIQVIRGTSTTAQLIWDETADRWQCGVVGSLSNIIRESDLATAETDPVFSASAASGISAGDITNWDTAYGWGNHSLVGYLTSESDPVFGASAAAGISAGNISNWNTAYGWGNHAGLYSLLGHTHTESDITDLDHDAQKIKGVSVAAPLAADDGELLRYNYNGGSPTLTWESIDSGAGGHTTIMPWNYNSINVGTWVHQLRNNCIGYGTWQNSSSADGDSLTYKVYMSAGTYKISIFVLTAAIAGICGIDIDASNVANLDMYNASSTPNVRIDQDNVVVSSSGIKDLTLYINGKNASATDYYMFLQYISFWRKS